MMEDCHGDGGLPGDGVQLRRQVEAISHDLVSVDGVSLFFLGSH
jgi:hypothetical protein